MNEDTNGLLRQYLPKGTDLSRWPAEDLLAVQVAINSRHSSAGMMSPVDYENTTAPDREAA